MQYIQRTSDFMNIVDDVVECFIKIDMSVPHFLALHMISQLTIGYQV